MILVGKICKLNSEYFLVRKHLVSVTSLQESCWATSLTNLCPNSVQHLPIGSTYFGLTPSSSFSIIIWSKTFPKKYIGWNFFLKIRKTEEGADYCQHFIYMKVLQKAVKKIAWGFPQLLTTTGREKNIKLILDKENWLWKIVWPWIIYGVIVYLDKVWASKN